jgi:hypothetical protein
MVAPSTSGVASATRSITALQSDPGKRRGLEETAREYLRMALYLLRPLPACLIAIGGFSGSGKSSLARALAPSVGAVPGALVVRSDVLRKRLCGVPELAHLGDAGYSPEVSRRVYQAVAERASLLLRGGHAVIADAVYARAEDRTAIEEVAARSGVPFVRCGSTRPSGCCSTACAAESGTLPTPTPP